jgi:archaellum biogenesis ATPase FlaH
LIYNDEYTRKVIPFIKKEYFSDNVDKIIFNSIQDFVAEYKNLPTYESLIIDISEKRDLSGQDLNSTIELLNDIRLDKEDKESTDIKWLYDQTEKFCQDKAVYNAIMESVNILDDSISGKVKGEIPKLLSDALGVSFDNNIGHDYINDFDSRYDSYHKKESRIRFDLEYFNRITKGGLPNKTLNIALAGTGVGKSLFMCHFAASCISQGIDVLYITLEMSEEKIAERIDANLMNLKMNDLYALSKEDYIRKFSGLVNKSNGKLIIKEYPTACASTLHFRALLNDLQIKKNFRPKMVIVDYLNICMSARMKQGANVNSYTYIKAIAEELRGLAVEFDVPVLSATQTTRSGFTSSDPGLEDTSESFGLPATADFMFALIINEELEKLGQIMVKQLKNRYSDLNLYKRFIIGVEKAKMRLFDVEDEAQNDLVDIGDIEDTTKRSIDKFNGFKV